MTPSNEVKNEAEWMKKKAQDLIDESVEAQPHRLSEIRVELTAIKSYFGELLTNILVLKASRLEDLRVEIGSVAGAKSKWASSPEGRNELILKGILERIKDQSSAIKQRIDVLREGSWGAY